MDGSPCRVAWLKIRKPLISDGPLPSAERLKSTLSSRSLRVKCRQESQFGMQRLLSNTLWAPFDNTERRLAGHERHVVRDYWLRQPFQGQRTDFFERRCPFDRHGNALAKQYLSILGLGTQPSGDIA